ncbi:NAD(P)/FAD-dependent oxidoreductase [Maribacter sp. PR1]|uniref:NAD(P)/FAD-dependent oxidoreductase n=1 Tax=Maribacter cobaltidurans TaxID=1178778 RepID=A0ABU7ISI9_9FLAO|nr:MULTISPECIES: NAD(P)/FAD-dependent oxidoreductase [Maribacter]MDC6388404.1 NAD(P)/FAD-dependent oxidoreductase [Maribacter sp. PR1]MEE1975793.1 NAD(P)/FAD-dependent oxidoreductase [Maribacter cobaltidurans]
MNRHEVIIVGGGLAGLTAAIALSRHDYNVAVFESSGYPHHKVCGEYVSNEIVPYLKFLGIDLVAEGGVAITDFEISNTKGKKVNSSLPIGGVGMSRYALDNILYKRAKRQNVHFYFEKVLDINNTQEVFSINTKQRSAQSKIVIGAYGKRSNLDKRLNRGFIQSKNGWLAVKSHYQNLDFPDNLVALHNFESGYGGLSRTETGAVNFCYLARYDQFQKHRNIQEFNIQVVSRNPHLRDFLKDSEALFDAPLSIGQISFDSKKPVVDHILMCGDTAGLIHPLCGNGMAMAIHSGKLVSETVHRYMRQKEYLRENMENDYRKQWAQHFKDRLRYGHYFQKILMQEHLLNWGINTLGRSEGILRAMIKKTHGKMVTP